ncbi:MAG: ABC transporter permease [Acidimicrobiia bacterium]|nr:ABC transporter permease [Acidimicrobiia bacterium]
MRALRNHLVRIGAIASKEIREVFRQPKLVLSVIVGPFLILGLFAVGFEARPPALRTVLVMPADSELADRAAELEDSLQPFIEVVGISQDAEAATRRLIDREIDLVVIAPSDAFETIRAGEHATIEVLHTRLDPFDQANIAVFSRTSIDELNRALLAEMARVGQEQVEEYDDAVPAAREAAGAYAAALRSGDDVEARRAGLELDRALLVVERRLASSAQLHQGLERGLGVEDDGPFGALTGLRTRVAEINESDPDAAERAEAVEADLADLETALDDVTRVPPEVAVQPFVPETRLVAGIEAPMTSYYAPAVMIVLIQHLALTFAALSAVREQTLGSAEVLRVGPTTVADLLLGKYLGYTLAVGGISAVLVAALVHVFGVPMAGSWAWIAILIALLILASLAAGFIIAGVSETESQAIQFSMLTLLFTIFFSGLVLPLDRIVAVVRGLAFAVPATSGVGAIQDVMFRGEAPRLSMLGALGGFLLVAVAISTWLMARRSRT